MRKTGGGTSGPPGLEVHRRFRARKCSVDPQFDPPGRLPLDTQRLGRRTAHLRLHLSEVLPLPNSNPALSPQLPTDFPDEPIFSSERPNFSVAFRRHRSDECVRCNAPRRPPSKPPPPATRNATPSARTC